MQTRGTGPAEQRKANMHVSSTRQTSMDLGKDAPKKIRVAAAQHQLPTQPYASIGRTTGAAHNLDGMGIHDAGVEAAWAAASNPAFLGVEGTDALFSDAWRRAGGSASGHVSRRTATKAQHMQKDWQPLRVSPAPAASPSAPQRMTSQLLLGIRKRLRWPPHLTGWARGPARHWPLATAMGCWPASVSRCQPGWRRNIFLSASTKTCVRLSVSACVGRSGRPAQ